MGIFSAIRQMNLDKTHKNIIKAMLDQSTFKLKSNGLSNLKRKIGLFLN